MVLADEPGGEFYASQDVRVEMAAAVLDKVQVDGIEWIRIQLGSDREGDFAVTAWVPSVADVLQGSGMVQLDPVYEYVEPDCPAGEPTLPEVAGMVPLLALHCFGSRTLTFAPVQARNLGAERSAFIEGTPQWLAEGGQLTMYWLPERRDAGSLVIQVDPASATVVEEGVWAEVSGQFDHPAAQQCTWETERPEFAAANDQEAVEICRARFVATGARRLAEAEFPPARPVTTPGPPPDSSIAVDMRAIKGPLPSRVDGAGVWTGTELIVWGGYEGVPDDDGFRDFKSRGTGAAYDPANRTWREIADGPLGPRAGVISAWTGTEMLVWGGATDSSRFLSDGAAYNPAADTWRRLSEPPMRISGSTSSAWTGSEWLIALSTRSNRVRVVAYDPLADSWRELPPIETGSGEAGQVLWTGREVLLMTETSGLWTLDPVGDTWLEHEAHFSGPVTVADELLFGTRYDDLATEPFGYDPWHYPVAWDPATGTEAEIPLPPRSAGDAVWTDGHLAFFEDGLLFDVEARAWLELDVDVIENIPFGRRLGAVSAWTGDRLVVWGGWSGCFEIDVSYDTGYELIPDFAGVGLGSTLPRQAGEGLFQKGADIAQHPFEGARVDPTLNVPAC